MLKVRPSKLESSSQRLIKNTMIIGLGNIGSRAIMFVLTILLARWLSKESYGLLDLYLVSIQIFVPFFTLSLDEAIFRFLLDKANSDKVQEVISTGIFASVIGCSIFVLVSILVYWEGTVLHSLYLMVLLFLESVVLALFNAAARGLKQITVYAVGNLLLGVVLTVATLIMVIIFDMELNGVLWGYILGYAAAILWISYAISIKKYIKLGCFNFDKFKDMAMYSSPLILNSTAWWVINVSDRYFINLWAGLAANGIYSAANKIPAILTILYSVFHISWTQSATEEVGSEQYIAYCNKVFNNVIGLVVSIATVLIASNFIIYGYIFGSNYNEAYWYAPIIIWALVMSCMAQFIGGIMIAHKDSKTNGFTNIMSALVNLILNIFLIRNWGLYGASFSTLIALFFLFILRFIKLRKYMNLKFERKLNFQLLLSLIITVAVYWNNMYVNIISLITAIILGGVANWKFIAARFIK